jgi:hypothetical protein
MSHVLMFLIYLDKAGNLVYSYITGLIYYFRGYCDEKGSDVDSYLRGAPQQFCFVEKS